MKAFAAVVLLVLVSSSLLFAGPMKEPYTGSAEFEKIKTLAGTWTGEMDMGQGPQPLTVEYKVVSNGSAVQERTFADTPMEMITIYHDKGGKLAMTHYCSLHNRPAMVLKDSDKDSIMLDFDPTCGVDAQREIHMHSLLLQFNDADTLTQTWTLHEDGAPGESHPIKLTRVGS